MELNSTELVERLKEEKRSIESLSAALKAIGEWQRAKYWDNKITGIEAAMRVIHNYTLELAEKQLEKNKELAKRI